MVIPCRAWETLDLYRIYASEAQSWPTRSPQILQAQATGPSGHDFAPRACNDWRQMRSKIEELVPLLPVWSLNMELLFLRLLKRKSRRKCRRRLRRAVLHARPCDCPLSGPQLRVSRAYFQSENAARIAEPPLSPISAGSSALSHFSAWILPTQALHPNATAFHLWLDP